MIFKALENRIRKSFSQSALHYEILSSLQKEIGRELVAKILNKETCSHILDVGMGTGWMSNRLSHIFPEARVVGIDFADGMTKLAKEKYDTFSIVQADAKELPFKKETFDIVISNLAYQWVWDLHKAFQVVHDVLKKDGDFCFTIFTKDSLKEMFASFEKVMEKNKDNNLPIQRLATQPQVLEAMQLAGFTHIKFHSEVVKTHFQDLFDLLQWLKKIGANVMHKEIYIGKELIAKANEYYLQNFKEAWGIVVSFEVLWVEAKK